MTSEQECQTMAQIATSSVLRSVLSFTTVCCLLSLPSCAYFCWRTIRSVKLHFNSKCVVLTHNFFILVHCSARLILHGKDLLNYFGPWSSGCEILPSRSRCELRLYYKVSQYAIELTPFILTAERFVATFQAHKYENRYKWCAVVLVGSHLSIALTLFCIQLASSYGGSVIIYYCLVSGTSSFYATNICLFFIFSSQFLTIPGLLYLLRKNQKYRETSIHHCASLSQRYQIFENLRTLSMFRIMSVVTWLYVTTSASALYVLHFFLPNLSYANQFAIIEICHCAPLYYLILTVLIFREDLKPRSSFSVETGNYHAHYFDDLQKFFDDAFQKINVRKRMRTEPMTVTTRTAF